MIEVVVSRYKEDISWTSAITNSSVSNVTVYNKFYQENKQLQNIGREGNTYLNHIVSNYDNLSEHTYFLQGNPLDHAPDLINIINEYVPITNQAKFFGEPMSESIFSISCPPHPLGLPMYYFFDLLFGIKLHQQHLISFVAGANFVVCKNLIHQRPKGFYEFLLKFLSYEIDPIEGYIIERLWPYIFNPEIPISEKYLVF